MKKFFITSRKQALPSAGIALALALFTGLVHATGLTPVTDPVSYPDGRPYPSYRMDAVDKGEVLHFGSAPGGSDASGAREALINQIDGKFYLYYDGAGSRGWLANLAESSDLVNWNLKGAILDLGAPGTDDSASASSPWIIKDESNLWHMYYLGTPNTSGAPDLIPAFPYLTLHATAPAPAGPWTKHYTPVPIRTAPGTFYSVTASPGQVVKQGNEYLMFFSSTNSATKRTIGIARTQSLDTAWTIDPAPALPVAEQIENSSLYYEPTNQTWFLFTNHIGLNGGEYTDAIWVYWTKDLNVWNAANKAVVLDGHNCTWSTACIGMPSVTAVGDKLHIFYDAPGGTSTSHMRRSIGRATLQLPLETTAQLDATPPQLESLLPANSSAGIVPSTNLVANFNEVVQLGAGDITVRSTSGGAVVETLAVTSGRVTVRGTTVTIDPVNPLLPNSGYDVEIAGGAIKDLVGNPFAGISGTTTWHFQTGVSNPVPIAVAESSFEAAKSISGWTGGSGPRTGESIAAVPAPWVSNGAGSAWASPAQYTDPMPDGDVYLYFNNAQTVTQTLVENVKPLTTYSLTVAMGWRKDLAVANPAWGTFPGYKIELLAGSQVVASDADVAHGGSGPVAVAGRWRDVVATYSSPESVPSAPLQIRITGYGVQTNYDNVRLAAQTWTPSNTLASYLSNPAFGLAPADQGPDLDPDGDQISNGLEAWFGTHPGQFNPGLSVSVTDGNTTTFSHPQNPSPPLDLTCVYQWSLDLTNWYAGDGIEGPVGGPTVDFSHTTVGNATSVTAVSSIPAGKLFVRVRAEQK